MNKFFVTPYILLFVVFIFLAFCSFQRDLLHKSNCDHRILNLVRDGDLIFRDGDSKESSLIKSYSLKDKTFSHVGICFIENGTPVVYNMLGGMDNPSGKMLRDDLCDFTDTVENAAVGVYELDIKPAEKVRLKHFIDSMYKIGVVFDYSFSLTNKDSLYCTELAITAIEYATNNRIHLSPIKGEVPTLLKFLGREDFLYYPIDYLQAQPFLKCIYLSKYQRSNRVNKN